MPEASQLRATGFFTTTLTFSGTFTCPIILGGTEAEEEGETVSVTLTLQTEGEC